MGAVAPKTKQKKIFCYIFNHISLLITATNIARLTRKNSWWHMISES
jgi:hypothetical protein